MSLGDLVTVCAVADEGSVFYGWYEGGELVSEDTVWSFRAEGNRTIKARFVELPFIDVTSSTSHLKDILWLAEQGISTGWDTASGKEFRPNANVKRGDMAAFLGRLATKSSREGTSKIDKKAFIDVTSKTSHCEEIWWMAANGISGGWSVSDGKEFRPNSPVKRGDMAAFLHRLDGVE